MKFTSLKKYTLLQSEVGLPAYIFEDGIERVCLNSILDNLEITNQKYHIKDAFDRGEALSIKSHDGLVFINYEAVAFFIFGINHVRVKKEGDISTAKWLENKINEYGRALSNSLKVIKHTIH